MIRRLLRGIFLLLLRTFFRRVSIVGSAPTGAVLYVANHPNALVDPMLLLCLAPQKVSFLAKEPLFRTPVLSWLVKAMDSLPVYRRQDGADTAENRQTLEAARRVLQSGGAIGLFPEGTSHSDPQMKPLKTGAARLALGARALGAEVVVVPVGLYYSDKAIFRSDAVVTFGQAIPVPIVALSDSGEPPREQALALTDQIKAGLADVTVQTESVRALHLVRHAEEIFNAEANAELPVRLATLKNFAEAYPRLKEQLPARVNALENLIERHIALLADLGLSAGHARPEDFTVFAVSRYTIRNLVLMLAWAPLATIGWLWHMPAYYLVRMIAFFSGGEVDQRATVKLLASLLAFPLSWIGVGMAIGFRTSWAVGLLVALSGPLFGFSALLFKERIERVSLASRGLAVFLNRRRHLLRLEAQRRAIHQEILALKSATEAT